MIRKIYADLDETGRLPLDVVKKAIAAKAVQNSEIATLRNYYIGHNELIMSSDHKTKIPAPFGRKLLKMVTGFMFKEGCITYRFPDEEKAMEDYVREIFDCNDEETENADLAKDQACFGSAFEAVYIDNNDAHIQFSRLRPECVIPVYEQKAGGDMVAAINFYRKGFGADKTRYVEIYYKDLIEVYTLKDSTAVMVSQRSHQFGEVPIIEFRNNEEGLGDIEPILKLIDAHDEAISTSFDEDKKFANAILLLKNFNLDEDSIKKLKDASVIDGMDETGEASYLTKPASYEGREVLRSTIEKLIHSMSGIPKLDDQGAISADSGEAMKYLYATFEMMVASEKQSGFTNGLQKRLRLISNFASWLGLPDCGTNGVEINWTRNLPAEFTTIIDNTVKVADRISQRTLLEKLHEADIVSDVDQEIERINEEKVRLTSGEVEDTYGSFV